MKKFLSLLLSLAICCSLCAISFAENGDTAPGSDYYPKNVISRKATYTDPNTKEESNGVSLSWINPTAANISSIKIYDVSEQTPIEIQPTNQISLTLGRSSGAVIVPEESKLNDVFELQFNFEDGIKTSYSIQKSEIQWGAFASWEKGLATSRAYMGIDTGEKYSGSSSLLMQRYEWQNAYMKYKGSTDGIIVENKYRVRLMYKTIASPHTWDTKGVKATILGNSIAGAFGTRDSNGWEEYSVDVTAVNTSIVFSLADTMAAVWIDDFSIRALDENNNEIGDNLITNGSFEDERKTSEITDAVYTGIDGGAVVNWTKQGYGTRVYLDGQRVAELSDKGSFTFNGLENGREYIVTLKDVRQSGQESLGAVLKFVAGEGPGTDLYNPDAFVVRDTASGVKLYWFNPWVAPTSIELYDVTANTKITATPKLEQNSYNSVSVPDSIGVTKHVYMLKCMFADGTNRKVYADSSLNNWDMNLGWQAAFGGGKDGNTHFSYQNNDSSSGSHSYSFGRYWYDNAAQLYNRSLAGQIEIGKKYRVSLDMKGKKLGTTTVYLEGNTQQLYPSDSKNWRSYNIDITATALSNQQTGLVIDCMPYMSVDNFRVYELDSNDIPTKEITIWNGDFEESSVLAIPEKVRAIGIDGGFNLKWNAPSGAAGINVYQDGKKLAALSNSSTMLCLNELTNDQAYSVTLKSFDSFGHESEGVALSAVTGVGNNSGEIGTGLNISGFGLYNADNANVSKIDSGMMSYKAKATVENEGSLEKKVMITIAIYEGEKMINVVTKQIAVMAGATENLYIDYDSEFTYEENTKAKVMLWDVTGNSLIPVETVVNVDCI